MVIVMLIKLVAGILLVFSFLQTSDGTLKVKVGQEIYYQSEKGETFTARYCSLSDGSLNFVKVTMPNGKEYTLPQVISASGARYTDDGKLTWWEHHGTVRIDMRDSTGEWKTMYQELRQVKNKK